MAAPRLSPPVQTAAFVGAVGALYGILGISQGDSDVAASVQWRVWRSVAALGIACAAVLGAYGWRRMRSEARGLRLRDGQVALQVLLAFLLFAAAIAFINLQPGGVGEVPIDHLWARLRFVEVATGLAVVPWLVLVWLTHGRLRRLDTPGERGSSRGAELRGLSSCWDLLSGCVFAFIALVVIALADTGALQAAAVASDGVAPAADESTTSLVLIYALYFSVLLAAVTIPLLAAYRTRAQELVDSVHGLPEDAALSADWVSSRARLAAFLHVDVGILRNPLTAFSVLTPLITAALALFIPELAGG